MEIKDFRKQAHDLVDWIADYLENIENYPVRAQVEPNDIYSQLPEAPPEKAEKFETIFEDFNKIIMPGMTHWQNPNFFAYFPANSSPPSILGEMLTSTLAAQCMIWQTSPAAAELEEMVMNWLKKMLSLPKDWSGVIQDTASSATLCAILTARERISNFEINNKGLTQFNDRFRIYCSTETHSSIDKAVKIAGLGSENLVKIESDDNFAMIAGSLKEQIENDIASGFKPLCVIATIGTTSSTAVDPVSEIGEICKKHNIWLHIDGAYGGSAMILPENDWLRDGLELADSFVFNPHKWMFTNFDCSAYFVKDESTLIRTFEILPEYLKTKEADRVKNYRDWGIALGRRFRALKLWFVIRTYGIEGLQEKIRSHIRMASDLKERFDKIPDIEILAPVYFGLICFRFHPKNITDESELEKINSQLLENINASGKMYITHTKLKGKYSLRIQIGQTYVEQRHVDNAFNLIIQEIDKMKSEIL